MDIEDQNLTKTLPLQLQFYEEGGETKVFESTQESRSVYNDTIRLAKQGDDWDDIRRQMELDTNLVKNNTQLVVKKALEAMENYYEYDDYNMPSHTKIGPYPLRMNHTEGYTLSLTDDGDVEFRISPKPYNPVRGTVVGDPVHLDVLKTALSSDEWKIGTAEALFPDGRAELHVNVTHQTQTVRDKTDSQTVIGVDVNEDNIALTAMDETGVLDTLVIDFPEIKSERHRYFTMKKRMQNAGKPSYKNVVHDREYRFVHDRLHKLSRAVVEFTKRFPDPCIALEDLKDMRESIDYGTRMNRRLHAMPFRATQVFIAYKAAFECIPIASVEAEYTSQGCALTGCEDAERANRRRKRFKCKSCGHQDHSDRNASVNVAKRGLEKCMLDVPTLKSLPQVRKVRRWASGRVNRPTSSLVTA